MMFPVCRVHQESLCCPVSGKPGDGRVSQCKARCSLEKGCVAPGVLQLSAVPIFVYSYVVAKPVRRKITKGIYKDKDTKALSHVACMNSAFGRKPKPDFIYLKRCASFVGKACYVHSLALSASHNCFYQDSS